MLCTVATRTRPQNPRSRHHPEESCVLQNECLGLFDHLFRVAPRPPRDSEARIFQQHFQIERPTGPAHPRPVQSRCGLQLAQLPGTAWCRAQHTQERGASVRSQLRSQTRQVPSSSPPPTPTASPVPPGRPDAITHSVIHARRCERAMRARPVACGAEAA